MSFTLLYRCKASLLLSLAFFLLLPCKSMETEAPIFWIQLDLGVLGPNTLKSKGGNVLLKMNFKEISLEIHSLLLRAVKLMFHWNILWRVTLSSIHFCLNTRDNSLVGVIIRFIPDITHSYNSLSSRHHGHHHLSDIFFFFFTFFVRSSIRGMIKNFE